MRKIFSKSLIILSFLTIAALSCTNKEQVNSDKMLFNSLPVSIKGDKISFNAEETVIRKEVERIFVDKNHLIEQVDAYGFAKDDLGVNYFYVKEVLPSGRKTTIAFFIKDLADIGIVSTLQGTNCVNVECCSECVPHSVLRCTCFTYDPECYGSGKQASCAEQGGGIEMKGDEVVMIK